MTVPILTNHQKFVLKKFYSKSPIPVTFSKQQRSVIEQQFSKDSARNIASYADLETQCQSFYMEIEKAISSEKNLQPGIFSECVYAQNVAAVFDMSYFFSQLRDATAINSMMGSLNTQVDLNARYLHADFTRTGMLVQAGDPSSVDACLALKCCEEISFIEFKEPYAKLTEADLPKYGENGHLVSTARFAADHPQYVSMLSEHIGDWSIWDRLGSNEHNFSPQSILKAFTGSYSSGSMSADFICTEDRAGYLTLLPVSHVDRWAVLEGEIRTCGKNSSNVWTPIKLEEQILAKGGKVTNDKVSIPRSALTPVRGRGGPEVTKLKINEVFFIRKESAVEKGDFFVFSLSDVKQIRPTIAAKVDFRNLEFEDVRRHYSKGSA